MGLKDNIMTTMAEASQISALLDRGCEFEGKLTFEGTVRVNGIFAGEIFSNDVLIVGDTAVVNAEIDVDIITRITENIDGNVASTGRGGSIYIGGTKANGNIVVGKAGNLDTVISEVIHCGRS